MISSKMSLLPTQFVDSIQVRDFALCYNCTHLHTTTPEPLFETRSGIAHVPKRPESFYQSLNIDRGLAHTIEEDNLRSAKTCTT
jgi:hypothetical protein